MSDTSDTDASSTEPSDEEDRRLFRASLHPGSVAAILCLKRDDPKQTHFSLLQDMNEETSRRLSHILGQNTRLTDLNLPCNFDVAELCAELQTNRFIQVFALMEQKRLIIQVLIILHCVNCEVDRGTHQSSAHNSSLSQLRS